MMRRSEKMAPRNNGTLLVTALLLIAAISRGQAENVHQLSGSDITLSPTYRGDFKEITWLLNNNKLMDLELDEKKEPIWYKTFPQLKAGASLNNQTGELTIPRLTIRDSGDYRAEVKLHDLTYHYTDITLTVQDPVVTPIITKHNTKDWIRLSCESATPGVSYEWQDDKGNIVSNETRHTIPTPTEAAVTLTCIASNAVSERRVSVTIVPPDPVVTPIITKHNTKDGIRLSCESATPGVSYEWQDDEGDIVSDDKTYTIYKPNKLLTLTCIASNAVFEGNASVTIVPPGGLPGWDIIGIIVRIFVAILIVVIIFEKIRGRYRYGGLSGWDIAGIVGIFVAILIVVIFEKIRGRYRNGDLSGWDIAGIIVCIFVAILIVIIIFEKIIWMYRYGDLSVWDITEIIGWIFLIILIVVIIFEKIRGRNHYGRLGKAINKCCPPFPYFPCLIRALRVKQSTSYYDDLLTHISECPNNSCCIREFAENKEGNLEKAEDLLIHCSECKRDPRCIRDEVIAWINRAGPNKAKDEENAEDNDTRPKAGEDL